MMSGTICVVIMSGAYWSIVCLDACMSGSETAGTKNIACGVAGRGWVWYTVKNGLTGENMRINWTDGFEIRVRIDEAGNVVISANKEGLRSLSDQLAALAAEPSATHIHYDENNSLEDGSAELIIERIP